jgi:ComF family protein
MSGWSVDTWRRWVGRLALPQRCVLCAEPGAALCEPCRADFPGLLTARCPRCAAESVRGQICGGCLSEPPRFSSVHVICSYGFPIDALIRRLKYGRDLTLVEPLAALLAHRVHDSLTADCIVPMPLAPLRLRERGFNQSHEIARVLARRLGVPIAHRACRRVRDSAPQAGLPLTQRRANIRGAFECQANLNGARVAVVDDVMTSGATLDEIARVLMKAGAASVEGWIVARTERA